MTNNTQPQLPADMLEEINKKAREYSSNASATDWKNGATEYANKLHQAQQEFGKVSTMFLDLDAKHEQARALLQKFISRHEAGLLPDRFIYNEIKTFLDGK
jgi:hypothetical protein